MVQRAYVPALRSCFRVQGWFSWFAPPEQKAVIATFRKTRDDLKVKVTDAEHALLLAQRDANKQLGLFSSHGKSAATDRLW